jgi:hypothetical protein
MRTSQLSDHCRCRSAVNAVRAHRNYYHTCHAQAPQQAAVSPSNALVQAASGQRFGADSSDQQREHLLQLVSDLKASSSTKSTVAPTQGPLEGTRSSAACNSGQSIELEQVAAAAQSYGSPAHRVHWWSVLALTMTPRLSCRLQLAQQTCGIVIAHLL